MRTLTLLATLFVVQLNSQTTLLWSESAGTSASSQKSFIATDLIGNIYMASSLNGTYGLDWKVSSWRPDSVSRWTYTYNGGGNLDDIPVAIVVDSAFSVFVAGTTKASGSNDIRVIKLDSAGNLKWGTNYNRTGSAEDVATGLAVTGSKLFVCGYSQQSTSNYDYTLLKYDTAGTLSWSRHANGSGNGDDYATAIAVKPSGDAYITGNAVTNATGSPRDMMTLRYQNDGTLSWTKYYGNTTGQHDYGNAIAINYSGDIIVTGQSYVTSTNSNLATVKYSGSNGTQAWAASYAGSYGGHDAANAIVIDPNNYFYVTGYMQVGSSNNDYVTIHYQGNGTLVWAQTYNGPGNGTDETSQIIHDDYDVVVTGKSTGNSSGLDVCTISLDKATGSVNWTMRYSSASSGSDCGYSLAKDQMGNVFVAYNEPSASSYANGCLRYYQKDKNDTAIATCLKVLSVGFSDLKTDTVFKRVIWYNIIRGFDDSIYVMYADALRVLGDAAGVGATTKISAKIATTYSWNSTYNWAAIKSKQLWGAYGKVNPLMGVPRLHQFSKSGFISATTNTAYTYLEWDYPVGCETCGDKTLDTADITGAAAWVFFVNIPPFVFTPEKQYRTILNCFAGYTQLLPQPCKVCPVVPLTSYSQGNDPGAGSHELGIWLQLDDVNYDCGIMFDANATDDILTGSANISPGIVASSNYAMLEALPGNYWRKSAGPNGGIRVRKSHRPHISDAHGLFIDPAYSRQFSNRISLCRPDNLFYDYYSSGGGNRLFLDFGGIYKIYRPGIVDLAPMYFYFSAFEFFTFDQGPDMNLNYDGQVENSSYCSGGNQEYTASPTIGNCVFANTFESSFNLSSGAGRPYFTNPVISNLTSYWEDNVITVGVTYSVLQSNNSVRNNYLEFYADNTGQTCTLPGNTGSLITSMYSINSTSSSHGDEYDVVVPLGAFYSTGYQFVVRVRARFVNGETIDAYQYLTVNSNFTSVNTIASMIRGNIEDYSATPINYQIDIYETI